MAVYVPLIPVPVQFQDTNGDNLASGTLEFYLSGTSTPTNLFSDNAGTSIGTSITLNSDGYPESGGNVITLFRDTSINYKIIAKDSSAVTVWTADTLNSNLAVLASTTNGEGASLVSIEDSGGNYTATDVEAALAELASTSTGEGASIIGVEDSGGNFTGTDVEAVLAELAGASGTTTFKYKTANESVTSSTTLQDDDHLTGWSLTAGEYYAVQAHISATSAATPDYKLNLSFSNAPAAYALSASMVDGSGNVNADATASTATDIVLLTSGNTDHIVLSGFFKANATTGGTVGLQWAQNTSDASPTQFNLGSWMRVSKVS